MPKPRVAGFTLVELLVVIAIIGILVSLLLPAVQAAREAARRTQCTNNLKQIALATLNYETQVRTLPPGAFWYSNDLAAYRGSILVHLLPFIEQQGLYDAFDFKTQVDGQTFADGRRIDSTIVAAYVCPSDTNRGLLNGRAIHNYCASEGSTKHADNSTSCSCSLWNSWNSFGLNAYETWPVGGVFYRRGLSTNLADIFDGTSNTIFFGEVRRDCSVHVKQGWAASNNGNGLVATQVPINYNSCNQAAPTGGTDNCDRPCNWSSELAFKSRHPAGAQFAFGDGSVHFLAEAIDQWTYQYLGNKADGKPVTLP